MKSLGETFGFSTLLTVLLPGLAVFIGLLMMAPELPDSLEGNTPAVVRLIWGESQSAGAARAAPPAGRQDNREWLQIFMATALVSLLGAIVAALNSFLETYFYDLVTPVWLGMDNARFQAQWHEYLHRLGKESNSYIDRIVNWFLFESRMAIAAVILLGIGLAFDRLSSFAVILLGLAFIGFALLAIMHHYELGEYRMTRFEDWQALRTAEVAVAERQAADAASARDIAARLGDVERKVRRLRRRIQRPPQPIGPPW